LVNKLKSWIFYAPQYIVDGCIALIPFADANIT
jgi:hypothetical protein